MGHGKGLATSLIWVFWLWCVGIMLVINFLKVKSADPTGVPEAGLLCISECTTCPAICAPPPPSSVLPPPPPPSTAHTKPPPSSNIPSIVSPPLPPSTTGPHGYSSYPYYYFYSSKANPPHLPASISCFLFLLLLSSHLVHHLC